MTDQPEPKPCPFCGAKPTVVDDAAVLRALRFWYGPTYRTKPRDVDEKRAAILSALNGDQT